MLSILPGWIRRHPVLGALLVAVLVLSLFLAVVAIVQSGEDPRLAAIRQAGFPVTLAELDAYYTRPPDAENRALLYERAFAQSVFREQSGKLPELAAEGLARNGAFVMPTDEDWAVARRFFESEREALDLLRSGTNCLQSRYSINLNKGLGGPLAHLGKIKKAIHMLTASALLAAHEGRAADALADFQAAGAVADSLKEEPVFISALVRFACWQIVTRRVEQWMTLEQLNPAQLQALEQMLAQAGQGASLTRGLAGERAFSLAAFKDPVGQTLTAAPGAANPVETLGMRVSMSAYKATGLLRKDRDYYLGVMQQMIDASLLEFPDRFRKGMVAGQAVVPGRYMIFSRMLLPALSKAGQKEAGMVAVLRAGQAAMAVERHRLAHNGQLPGSLEALGEAVFKTLPADPFNGEPLRYKKLTRGYVIYSVGTDGADDGGIIDTVNKTPAKDAGIKVER